MQFTQLFTVMHRFRLHQGLLYLAQLDIAVEHEFDRRIGQGRRFLRDVGDHPMLRDLEIARFRMQLAPQHGEQAGFSGAIGTGETDLMARVQLE